jgi:hypothetical protein
MNKLVGSILAFCLVLGGTVFLYQNCAVEKNKDPLLKLNCGGWGQDCCQNRTCESPYECSNSNRCVTASGDCGNQGDPCCIGTAPCNGGLSCLDDICDTPAYCGALDQDCCSGGTECNSGLICQGGKCENDPSANCGAAGQSCCSGGNQCDSDSLNCVSGTCESCGYNGQECCDNGPQCANSSLTCQGQTCVPTTADDGCGGEYEWCCDGDDCDGSLSCNAAKICVSSGDTCGVRGEDCCGTENFLWIR